MGRLKKLLEFLLHPTARYSVLAVLGVGLAAGIVSVVAFEITMTATNTEQFCTSCHEMRDNPGMLLKPLLQGVQEAANRGDQYWGSTAIERPESTTQADW